jgi:hypothetical protein
MTSTEATPANPNESLLLTACARAGPADLSLVKALLEKEPMLVHTAKDSVNANRSALHNACASGSMDIVKLLLENGAQWNIVDDGYIAAGDLARDAGHEELYSFLVERGVETELLIKVLEGHAMDESEDGEEEEVEEVEEGANGQVKDEDEYTLPNPLFVNGRPVQPPSKPGTGTDLDEYLSKPVSYEDEHGRLLDHNGNAIEMEWERILMEKHSEVVAPVPGLSVMNVGFGMGMVRLPSACVLSSQTNLVTSSRSTKHYSLALHASTRSVKRTPLFWPGSQTHLLFKRTKPTSASSKENGKTPSPSLTSSPSTESFSIPFRNSTIIRLCRSTGTTCLGF